MLCTNTTETFIPNCPLTCQPIDDPVSVDCPCHGYVGREAFAQWVQVHLPEAGGMPMCPCCGENPLRSLDVRSCTYYETATSRSRKCQSRESGQCPNEPRLNYKVQSNENKIFYHLQDDQPSAKFHSWPDEQKKRTPVQEPKTVYSRASYLPSPASSLLPNTPESNKTGLFRNAQTLTGIGDYVLCCTPFDSGRRIINGCTNGLIKILNTETGRCERVMKGHTNWVDCCTMLEDGKRFVSGGRDHTLKVWDLKTGKCLKTLKGHKGRVTSCVTKGPCRIVSSSDDKTLKIWNVDIGVCEKTLRGHTDSVFGCEVLANGQQIVSCSADRSLRVWDSATGQCMAQTTTSHRGAISCCAIYEEQSGTGGRHWVVTGSDDKTVKIWNLDTGLCERTLRGHTDWIMGLTVLGGPRPRIVSASGDQTLKVWNLDDSTCEQTLTGHSWVVACCASLGEDRFVSGSYDRTVKVWTRNA